MDDRNPLTDLIARLRPAEAELSDLAPAVEAGRPWPLSDNFGTEPEAHWGPPETLAHVAEMVPFWTGEIERILAGESEPVPFGRVATNELRLGIIERDRSLPPRELFARIHSDTARLAARLEELTPAEAGRRGQHPRLGEMTVAEIVPRFLVGHLSEHVVQLRGALGGH
jgi:hypothetical protein